MYKLFHKLFGWDYAIVDMWGYELPKVRRIYTSPNGLKYVKTLGCYQPTTECVKVIPLT